MDWGRHQALLGRTSGQAGTRVALGSGTVVGLGAGLGLVDQFLRPTLVMQEKMPHSQQLREQAACLCTGQKVLNDATGPHTEEPS